MTSSFHPQTPSDVRVPVSNSPFLARVVMPIRDELERQGIQLELDLDPQAVALLPCEMVHDVLRHMARDACRQMMSGGHLELTVVRGSRGIEIELADSRRHDTMDHHDESEFMRAIAVANATRAGIRIETMRCPQGGLARTLILPAALAQPVIRSRAA